MEYIAHKREEPEDVQPLIEHLRNVADMASSFASVFSAGEYGRCAGILHDIGKYSSRFQKYIRGDIAVRKGEIDHSSAGAQVAHAKANNAVGMILAYCISGHHSGLLDGGSKYDDNTSAPTLWGRLNKNLDDYSAYNDEVLIPDIPSKPCISLLSDKEKDKGNFSLSFFIRMVFSCLVDSDFLDTENYMMGGATGRSKGDDISFLKNSFDSFVDEKGYKDGHDGINGYRSQILRDCIKAGREARNFFTLTVPTGGGKTISSMAFALEQAVRFHKDRIIYVIPYCSIIEQTVDIFQNIFGTQNVLAAFSNADYDDENLRLATDNWDKPIVVTTSVQFFESFYSNKTSTCRKLHNVANSVIIFDEAQLIPEFRFKPCVRVIEELGVNYSCTEVLCTATQPSFNEYFENVFINHKKENLELSEICTDTTVLYDTFRRVTYVNVGRLSNEELSGRLSDEHQVLCIVSTRKQAADVFELLTGDGIYHLSTLMTAEHRRSTLQEIRECLTEGKRCVVVSTSLIEAGVDVDFPCVYRAIAGLDSIIQAGGRCNREGKRSAEESRVYIFEPDEKYKTPAVMKRPIETEKMVTGGADDISAPDVIKKYFDVLHEAEDSGAVSGLDTDGIIDLFEKAERLSYPFATVGKKFRMIDSDTYSVFIPVEGESDEIVWKIENDIILSPREYRFIGSHSVNIYENEFKKIRNSVNIVDEKSCILADADLYDDRMGLRCDDEKSGEAIFF